MTIEVFRPILVKRLSCNLNHTKVYEVVVFLMSLYGSTIQDPYHLIFLLYIYILKTPCICYVPITIKATLR